MALPLEDYGVIGDCQTAALVGRNGSIDWLCFPRFDSPACFAKLLGDDDNGFWRIAPAGETRHVRRSYGGDTMVLETEFHTADGVVALLDFMPPRDSAPDVVRIVEGRRGRVTMDFELAIRFDYGSIVPWVRHYDTALEAVAGPDAVEVRGTVPLHGEAFRSIARFDVAEGDRRAFTLTWYPSHTDKPAARNPETSLAQTEEFWREWSSRCTYSNGEWRDVVVRSLLTLKTLTYAPTGGLLAAATTSLPEMIGGSRNWDYRYCWVRDATFTLYALLSGGYVEEARAWREWLLRAVAGQPSQMHIMYGLAGERRLTELELAWLPGYEGSAPVRIGNAAAVQHQLDVYGEVMDALHLARRAGLPPDENAWRLQQALMEFLESDWQKPDEGIWEIRGPRRQFTHSKVMAWVACDRAVKAIEQFGLEGPVDRWRALREEVRADILARGYDAHEQTFVQSYGSKMLDASLLMIPLVGFLPATDPRMVGTVAAIQARLTRDGFVDRYVTVPEVDGLPPGEGAFLICTLWLADNLALQNRYGEAREIFERVLAVRNDLGLLAEEYDPHLRRMVGNFPQALSHLGVINTARNLSRGVGPAEDRASGAGPSKQDGVPAAGTKRT